MVQNSYLVIPSMKSSFRVVVTLARLCVLVARPVFLMTGYVTERMTAGMGQMKAIAFLVLSGMRQGLDTNLCYLKASQPARLSRGINV